MTSKTTDKKSRTNAGTFKRGRRPHNAPIKDYSSFADMVRKIADEPRKAQIAGREVVISRSEGVYRSMVDRALRGNKRELIILLRMMMRRPSMAATFRKYHVTVVGGSLAKV